MKHNKRKNQRGSALLITLGILSLTLILAMSFAFSARTTRQVAKISTDSVRAKLFTESATDRVIGAMRNAFKPSDPNDPTTFIYFPAEDDPSSLHLDTHSIQTNGTDQLVQKYVTIGSDNSAEV
ncbi:MAG: hypothetical protein IJJ26_13365, partial [Victivallales bacterium]|nr:hypothetical protein [Victivallales bacterium]